MSRFGRTSSAGALFSPIPRLQSAPESLGAGLWLVSDEEFTSLRLRRQPTGLTLGSFPWGALRPLNDERSFCTPQENLNKLRFRQTTFATVSFSPIPRLQSAPESLGAGLRLVSDEEFTSLRLRRQPTGLTLGSFPWGALRPLNDERSFCTPQENLNKLRFRQTTFATVSFSPYPQAQSAQRALLTRQPAACFA